ncbi:MAG: NAD(P)-dependent oxidoreductase [Chloroflexi bacterium]|nr:NAD(P)-dependent oxidoreductase [Chloroflexota bacterium]
MRILTGSPTPDERPAAPRRLAILGASSPIARTVRDAAIAAGHAVVTVGRRDADVLHDVADPGPVPELPGGADVVICAIGALGDGTLDGWRTAAVVNAAGPLAAVAIAETAGAAHVVLLSTIYAGHADRYTGPPAYPVTKRHGEELARLAARAAGRTLTVLRPSHVYGSDPLLLARQPLLAMALERSRLDEELVLHGSGTTCRDYLHVDDLAAMVLAAADRRVEGTVDCGSPGERSFRELVEIIYRARGLEPRIRLDAGRPDAPEPPPLDREASADALGVRARIPVDIGLHRVVTDLATDGVRG